MITFAVPLPYPINYLTHDRRKAEDNGRTTGDCRCREWPGVVRASRGRWGTLEGGVSLWET